MKTDHMIRLAAVSACALFASCNAEVELCTVEEHPHRTPLQFVFEHEHTEDQPEKMYVIANRIVNARKYSMAVDTETGSGNFLFNEDLTGQPDNTEEDNNNPDMSLGKDDSIPDEEGAGNESGGNPEEAEEGATDSGEEKRPLLEQFPVRSGNYKFFTLALNPDELVYDEVDKFMNSAAQDMRFSDMWIEYKTYEQTDPEVECSLVNWDDYNPYAKYIRSDISAITFDSIPNTSVQGTTPQTIRFRPKKMTQNIDVYLDIQKDISRQGFVIDAVTAEISGVPKSLNPANGYIDITRTAKMMFDMEFVDEQGNKVEDSYDSTTLRCHANINVTSIVQSKSSSEKTGVGIMQLVLHTHALTPDDPTAADGKRSKRMQGKINLFNTLEAADLIEIVEEGKRARRRSEHGVLDIKSPLLIDGMKILESPTDDGGIDRWIPCESFIVDI